MSMSIIDKTEMLAKYYLDHHDFSDLKPAELAEKYTDICKEIKQYLDNQSDSKPKITY
jgi:hypothetical protein